MANKAISELPQAENVNNQDLFVLEQGGLAKKLTAETFITEQGIIDALAEALDGHGGIQSVTLSSVSGRIRTYRITFTDQSATTFQVYDGTSIDRISRTSSSGLDDVYTVFLSDGTTTFFTVHNGADGTVSEAMLNDALKDKAPAVTETTESSAIATFPDGADDMVMHNVVAEINPVQDLTYGSPYPAGGGKNLIGLNTSPDAAIAYANVTASEHTDDSVKLTSSNSTYASMNLRYTLKAGTYTLKYQATSSDSFTPAVSVYKVSGSVLLVNSAPPNTARSFTLDEETTIRIQFFATLGTAAVRTVTYSQVQIESGSSATDWSPYSNICPITGRAGCNVTRTGKNLLSVSLTDTTYNGITYTVQSDGSILATGTATAWATRRLTNNFHLRSGSYIFSNGATLPYWVLRRVSNSEIIDSATSIEKTVAITEDDYYCEVTVQPNKTISNVTIYPMIRLASNSDSTFEPYTGNQISVNWQTEAGTVYGGTIDVATGLLTVTHALYNLKDTSASNIFSYDYNGKHGVYFRYAYGIIATRDSGVCNMAHVSTEPNYSASQYMWFGVNSNNVFWIGILDALNMTLEEFKTWIQSNDVYITRRLATPQTYQLSGQQLMTIFGTNNVWTDIGNVSVTYTADTKMFIEKLTMPTEDDLVANQAITSGKYFMIGNSLYLALANIASGAQITIGTNAQRVSLADALNTINT